MKNYINIVKRCVHARTHACVLNTRIYIDLHIHACHTYTHTYVHTHTHYCILPVSHLPTYMGSRSRMLTTRMPLAPKYPHRIFMWSIYFGTGPQFLRLGSVYRRYRNAHSYLASFVTLNFSYSLPYKCRISPLCIIIGDLTSKPLPSGIRVPSVHNYCHVVAL